MEFSQDVFLYYFLKSLKNFFDVFDSFLFSFQGTAALWPFTLYRAKMENARIELANPCLQGRCSPI